MLSTVDPTFPLDVWDLLLPQSELTINLLRSSSFCPHTSAWHALHGPYNFDHEPIAPPGMRVTCFETPLQRASWAPHGIDGYYVGPSFNHHRCFKVRLPSTGACRDTAQLAWHPPALYTLPGASPYDDVLSNLSRLEHSVDELSRAHPSTHHSPTPLC